MFFEKANQRKFSLVMKRVGHKSQQHKTKYSSIFFIKMQYYAN